MTIELAEIPYTDGALEPVISSNTLRTGGGQGAQGAIGKLIKVDVGDWGSFAGALKSAANGYVGSDSAGLVLGEGKLKFATISNVDTPIVRGHVTLLVRERACYLYRRERRAAYVGSVVEFLLNWGFAKRKFERSGASQHNAVTSIPAAG